MSADPEEAKATEVKEDQEEALKEDFQSLRQIITDEDGHLDKEGDDDDDDDDETCGFCRFMKAGGCKPEFTAWSACVDANRGEEHNFTEECRDATLALQGCMEQHRDYYKDFMLEPDVEDRGAGSEDAAPKEEGSTEEGAREGAVAAAEPAEQGSPGPDGYEAQPKLIGNLTLEDEPLPPTDHMLSGLEGKFQDSVEAEHESGGKVEAEASGKEGDSKEEGEESKEEGGEEEGGGEEAEEEEAEAKPVIEIRTSAYDARFPSTNQARHCYTRYNEYHRCLAERGEDAPECSVFQRAYRSLCPGEWVERWNEQREEGTWPGRY